MVGATTSRSVAAALGAYCEHVADVDGKGEHRKDHVHVIIVFGNTTTYRRRCPFLSGLARRR